MELPTEFVHPSSISVPQTNAASNQIKSNQHQHPSLKILSTNARSITAKIDELKATAIDLDPDIMAITESWTNSSISDPFLSIPGYRLIARKDRADTTCGRGGGILMYAKSKVTCHEIATPDDVVQVAAIQAKLSDQNLNVYVIYRSPNSTPENNERINQLVRNIPENSIILGDFNYPHIDWELLTANSHAADFLDAINDNFITQHVNFPTHNGGNTLDLVLSNIPNKIISTTDAGILGNSDHNIILTEVDATASTHVPKHAVWNFRLAKFDHIRTALKLIEWSKILTHDMETDWNIFKTTLNDLCKKYIPKKTVNEIKRPPWLKRDLLRLIRQKRAAWKAFKASKSQVDENNFRELQKKVKKLTKSAKHKHEVQISREAKTNPKLFYSYLSKKKKNRVQVGPLRNEDGDLCHDNKCMAEVLNKQYSKVFTTEDPNLPADPLSFSCPEMADIRFTPYMIAEVLRHVKNSSSPGTDGISQRVLKEAAEEVSVPLSLLFNKSMQTNTVPTDWKTANVVPIFKSGAKGEPSNYRPISLTSVVVRVMERILKQKILLHLNVNKLINQSQHGFLPKKSTSTNLISYVDYLTKKLDDGLPVDVLYLDFSKAFDVVPHKRLIQKLKCHKLSKEVIAWIETWLANRKQRVMVDGIFSDWTDVESSVIQGSVLGPILFVIFINDIDQCLGQMEGILPKFADDTKLAKVVNNSQTAAEMQLIIKNLETWCKTWGMKFNAKKCSIIHFGKQNPKFSYTLNGQALDCVSNQRDLGVKISNSCLPGEQCAQAAKKANQVLGQINRSFSCKTMDVMTQIYKVFVRPHLEYAVTAWSPWLRKDVEALEKIQHRATRRMSDVRGTYPERLQKVGLTTLEERRVRGDAIEVFKYLRGFLDVDKDTLFTMNIPKEPKTRHQNSFMPLFVPRANLDLRKNFFSVRGATLWNSLPSELRECNTVNKFKNTYDKYFTCT